MESGGTYTTTTTTKVVITPRFDPTYTRTIPGILKCARLVTDLIGFICIMLTGGYYYNRANWFSFVSMTGFWVTLILLAFYLFHLIEKTYFLPWNLIEFIFCAVWTLFYLIAVILAIASANIAAFAVAALFGIVSLGMYGYDAFLKFKGWRNGELAQGERTVSSSVSSPNAY